MIEVKKNDAGQIMMRLEGSLSEVSAECVMVMREIYKRGLVAFTEPEIASGILVNMFSKALDIEGRLKELEKIDAGG